MMCEYNAQQKGVGGRALKKNKIASATWASAFVQKWGGGGGVAWASGLLRPRPLPWIRHCNVVTSTEKLQIMIVYL